MRWHNKDILIAYFLVNIFANNYHWFMYVKVIARQTSVIFGTQCIASIIPKDERTRVKHNSVWTLIISSGQLDRLSYGIVIAFL